MSQQPPQGWGPQPYGYGPPPGPSVPSGYGPTPGPGKKANPRVWIAVVVGVVLFGAFARFMAGRQDDQCTAAVSKVRDDLKQQAYDDARRDVDTAGNVCKSLRQEERDSLSQAIRKAQGSEPAATAGSPRAATTAASPRAPRKAIALAKLKVTPEAIALDDSAAYVAAVNNDGKGDRPLFDVLRVPFDGGTQTVLAAKQALGLLAGYQVLIATKQALFWQTGVDGAEVDIAVVKLTLPAGSPTAVGRGNGTPLAADATGLYFGDVDPARRLMQLPFLGGGKPRAIATTDYKAGLGVKLALDERNVYWVASISSGEGREACSIMKASLAEGVAEQLVRAETAVESIASDGQYVYWTQRGEPETEGLVRRVSVNGGVAETLASAQAVPERVLVDGTHVYWATGVRLGIGEVPLAERLHAPIMRAPKNGSGSAEVFVDSGTAFVTCLSVDASYVYWCSAEDLDGPGTVFRTRKGE